MKLEYQNIKEDSYMVLTNFNCEPSQQLLKATDLYKIVWCKDEAITIRIDGYSIPMETGQILFCTPLNIIEIPREDGLIAFVFNREFYCIRDHDAEVSCNGFLFFGSSQPPLITLNSEDKVRFEAMFTIFQDEFKTRDHIQGEMLRVMLKRLLIKSSRLVKQELQFSKMPSAQFDIIRQYHVLVEKYFREKHQVSEYADLLFKSPKTLSNLFKKAGGKLPRQIITDRIVLEAKRLLLFSNKTSEQIAYELGFKNAAHFSILFKAQTSIPPGTFKSKKVT